MYKSYYFDNDTEMYYLNSRFYHPSLRRFITMDDVNYLDKLNVSNLNLYSYSKNNPIMYYDPSGHFPWLIVIAVITGVSAINYNKSKEYSEELELTGSEKFWNIVGGILFGSNFVIINNWDKVSDTIVMDGYNFDFEKNPYYNFFTAWYYAKYLKQNDYSDEPTRTTLGLYIELQAHYIFMLLGNSHGEDGAYMGPADASGDITADFCESVASFIMNLLSPYIL